MTMKIYFIFAGLALAQGMDIRSLPLLPMEMGPGQVMGSNTCDMDVANRCTAAVAQSLGLKEIPSNALELVHFIDNLYQTKGVSAFLDICSIYDTMVKCMGPQYDLCLNMPSLMKMGLDHTNSAMYTGTANQFKFQCGPAKQVVVKNFGCIVPTQEKNKYILQQCMFSFFMEQQRDPSKSCQAFQTFTHCYAAPFNSACGGSAAWLECSTIAKGFQATLPQCQPVCPNSQEILQSAPQESVPVLNTEEAPLFPVLPAEVGTKIGQEMKVASTCDLNKAMPCFMGLANTLGLKEMPADALSFVRLIEAQYKKDGVAAFDHVCSAFDTMSQCLGAEYTACLSKENLMQMGLDRINAGMYSGAANQYQFQCGAAKQITDKYFDCIQPTKEKNQETLKQCMFTFFDQQRKDPSKSCEYLKSFTECYAAPFSKACGNPAGWVECATIAKGWAQSLPQCQTSCTMNADGSGPVQDGAVVIEMDEKSENSVQESVIQPLKQGGLFKPPFPYHVDALDQQTNFVNSDSCILAQFKTCLAEYGKTIGLNGTVTVASFLTFLKDDLKTKSQFKTLCTAGKTLDSCLGSTEESCFSATNLKNLGLNQIEIVEVQDVKLQLGYECGKGFDVFYKNFECFAKVEAKHKDSLEQCEATFKASVQKHPKDICQAAQKFTDCETRVFAEECPKDADSAFCHVFNIGLMHNIPQCHLTCP